MYLLFSAYIDFILLLGYFWLIADAQVYKLILQVLLLKMTPNLSLQTCKGKHNYFSLKKPPMTIILDQILIDILLGLLN